MNGFTLDAKLDIDESLDIYRLGIKPKHALKINGGTDQPITLKERSLLS